MWYNLPAMSDPHVSAPDDEPKTPMWLPALGAALFLAVGLAWAVSPASPPPPPEAAASAAPAPPAPAPIASAAPSPGTLPAGAPQNPEELQRRLKEMRDKLGAQGNGGRP